MCSPAGSAGRRDRAVWLQVSSSSQLPPNRPSHFWPQPHSQCWGIFLDKDQLVHAPLKPVHFTAPLPVPNGSTSCVPFQPGPALCYATSLNNSWTFSTFFFGPFKCYVSVGEHVLLFKTCSTNEPSTTTLRYADDIAFNSKRISPKLKELNWKSVLGLPSGEKNNFPTHLNISMKQEIRWQWLLHCN